MLSSLDLSCTLAFFTFTVVFIVWTRRLARLADEDTITLKDYSVIVSGHLPEDITSDELKEPLEVFHGLGPVVRVDLAHRFHQVHGLLTDRARLIAREERLLAHLQMTASGLVLPAEVALTEPICPPEATRALSPLEREVVMLQYDIALLNRGVGHLFHEMVPKQSLQQGQGSVT